MRSILQRLTGALLPAALAWFIGCSSPSPLKVPVQDGITLEGNTVRWSTDEPTLGSVRYGTSSGVYNRVAYPASAARADLAYATEHRVPLLSVSQGEKIYLQVLDRAQNGGVVTADEVSFTVGTRPAPKPFLSWTMIDVGFGDSHILTMPNTGKRIIIDGGERRDWANVDAYLQAAGVSRLDVAMATHVHSDHIGGLVGESYTLSDGVLGAYDIGRFLDTPLKSDMNSYAYRSYRDELLPTLRAKSVPIDTIRAGDTSSGTSALVWDGSVGVEVLNSGYGSTFGGVSEGDVLNNDSVILRLTYGDVNLMLGGDAEAPVTTSIAAAKGSAIDTEVLKVHHHGLDDSSPADWVNAVNPRVGLIPITTYESSLGTLPSESVLIRLRNHRTDIYASDRAEPLGLRLTNDKGYNVTLTTDGVSYEVSVALSQSVHYAPVNYAPAMPAEDEVIPQ